MPLELSCIVIAGATGIIIVGNSWLFPGTSAHYCLGHAWARRAVHYGGHNTCHRSGSNVGEFLTRHYQSLYDVSRIFCNLIFISFIIGYFVIYPKMVVNQLKEKSITWSRTKLLLKKARDLERLTDSAILFFKKLETHCCWSMAYITLPFSGSICDLLHGIK